MGGPVVSEIRKDYLAKLAAEGKRVDGRGFEEYRPFTVETGIISQAEGSSRVKLGGTDVFCGVKMQIGTPFPDTPDVGAMMTAAELIPMASPDFEAGPPRPPAIELSRVVDRGLREAKTIDMKKLCITHGEKVWIVYADFHIVDYDGNLYDACSLAGIAALLTAKVPASKQGLGDDYPLPVDNYPIMTTAMKVGGKIVWDPSLAEDEIGGPRLSVSTDQHGAIRAMQKGLEGALTNDEVLEIIRTAPKKGEELRAHLFKEIGFKPPK